MLAYVAAMMLLAASCGGKGELGPDEASAVVPASSTSTSLPTTAATAPPTTESATTQAPTTESTTTTTAAATTLTTLAPSCPGLEPGASTITVSSGGNSYETRIYIPSAFEDGQPTPVVLDFHGLGSTGIQQVALTDYEALAKSEGFIVVHPTGLNIPGRGASWELNQTDIPDRDDLAYASELIDLMTEEYCGDANRIYSTGMSNGGFFTSRLVCELADRIAAASSIAGVSHFEGCEPSRDVPFLAFHGTNDKVVPFSGGTSTLGEGVDGFFDQVMPEEFAEFAADAGCSPEPDVEIISDEVSRFDYVDCDGDTPMSFYEIAGGGHTWPGSPIGPLLTAFLGKTTEDVNATKLSWKFFSEHTLN